MFFKNKNNKLRKLQELTKELKDYEEGLKMYSPSPDYDKYDLPSYSMRYGQKMDELGILFSYAFQHPMSLEDFIECIERYLCPKDAPSYLEKWGYYLIQASKDLKHKEAIESRISDLKKEIYELKKELKID